MKIQRWSLTVLILERGGERRLLLHFCFFLRHPTLLLLIPQLVSSLSCTQDKGAGPPLDVTRDPVPYLLGYSVKAEPPLDKEASHILLLLPVPSYLSSLGALQKACALGKGAFAFSLTCRQVGRLTWASVSVAHMIEAGTPQVPLRVFGHRKYGTMQGFLCR